MKKYEIIYKDIKNEIESGKLKVGEFLIKEDDLAEKYNFSKLTVRKGLSLLETEGYIQKIKGKKSIILEKKKLENVTLTSIQTMQEINKAQNINVKTNLISLYIVQGDQKLMKEFQVPANADFYKVVRSNTLDGEVLNYSTTFFDRKIVPFLSEETAKKSIYEYLEKELNLKIAYSRRNISFRKITDEEQQHFKLKDINMVVVIETHAYLSNGMLFQYETIVHHPEKFYLYSYCQKIILAFFIIQSFSLFHCSKPTITYFPLTSFLNIFFKIKRKNSLKFLHF